MKVIAPIASSMPTMIFAVNVSLNIIVPTRIAVIGSNTPNTDAFVAPILRVAKANVAVEIIVGNMASPMRFNQSLVQLMPAVISVPEWIIIAIKITAPTDNE